MMQDGHDDPLLYAGRAGEALSVSGLAPGAAMGKYGACVAWRRELQWGTGMSTHGVDIETVRPNI